MSKEFTLINFLQRFPTNDACLEYIFKERFGNLSKCPKCKCGNPKFQRLKKRKCYACDECRYQIFPLAGTVMQGSITPLMHWFLVLYMFSISKNGISANEIQRLLGVSYQTAWRMANRIRKLMKQNLKLKKEVEIDETMIGGHKEGKRGWGAEGKTKVFGLVEPGGRVQTLVVPDRQAKTLIPIITERVEQGSLVRSDKFGVYNKIPAAGFKHEVKNHGGTINTNHIEGYWSNLKKSLRGTHTWVNERYLQTYLNEHDFRYNKDSTTIFNQLIHNLCHETAKTKYQTH